MSQSESSASEHVPDVQLQEPEVKECKKKKSICHLCNKELRQKALYTHMRKVHNEEPIMRRNTTLICPEPTCGSSFYFRHLLRDHIHECHGVKIELCVKKFSTFNDFEVWKGSVEKETNSRFSVCHAHQSKGKKIKYYSCHRSGIFISKATGKKKRKNIDSRKINGWCPASMDVVITEEGGIKVEFWKTHFGHTCEVGQLILTREEKIEIANKIKKGIGFQKILDEVRDSVLEGDVRRIHLLKKKDLYNISRSFQISNKENLLQKEQDINSWVDSMKALGDDCPIIFYKEKGVEQLTLKSPEFFLVIMTKLQQKMSLCCGNTIVCIDCIYHIHTFSYYLITLMATDIYNSVCPLAYCVTNRINNNTISLFYNCVKSTAGTICTNLFMSVDKPLFYTEWQNVMGSVDNHLLCSWDIDRSWRQKLDKYSVPLEMKVRVYKKLRLIMQEAQYGDFHTMLETTLNQFEEDDGLKEFVTYFRSKYIERSELWANCYRSDSVLHSSMILEQLHRDLHHCYMEGQSISSIVRVLNLVMEISRDKLSEKLENLPRELKLSLIGNCALIPESERNKKQMEVETAVDDATSLGNTISKTKEVKETVNCVNHKPERVCPPDCKPICSMCSICLHKFTCSCLGFKVLDTCPHIRASIEVLKDRCMHATEQCEPTQTEETVFQNVAHEMVIELSEDQNDVNSRVVAEIVNTEEETQQAANKEEVNIENFKSLLLQKVEILHHLLENNTCEIEKYEIINEHFDKIIELL